MESKICISCNELKMFSEYSVANHYKDGLNNQCKTCNRVTKLAYTRSKKGLTSIIYGNQKSNAKKRGHSIPTYSAKELREWLFSQPEFHRLYDNWKRLDYQIEYVPSVDRKDDYISYTMDNIQLMTFKENCDKSYSDRRNGINNKSNQKVHQYTLQGEFMRSYHSQTEASRVTGIPQTCISAVCLGNQESTCGYIWSKDIR